jgi:short-subunit dehydrogenase
MTHEGIVVVTGASRGVGRAAVRELVRVHGRRTLAVARDAAALANLREELSGALLETCVLDLASPGAPKALVAAVAGRTVSALVNNAGSLLKRDFGAWTSEELHGLYHVNVAVPLLLAQALLHQLEAARPGHVVNIGSMGGVQGSVKFPGLLGYSTSKGALVTLTECMAEELKERGVRVNCLCLGAVDTEMLREAFPGFQAPVSADDMGAFVARFSLEGRNLFNGNVLEVALGTP